MLVRSAKKVFPHSKTHRLTFSEFDQPLRFSEKENLLEDRFYLRKAKQELASTEKNLLNRIRLLKNEEKKLLKKKQNEVKLFNRLQEIKDGYNTTSKTLNPTPRKRSHLHITSVKKDSNEQRNRDQSSAMKQVSPFTKRVHKLKTNIFFDYPQIETFKGEKIALMKMQNAKMVKEEKSKNQQKISKQKNIELNRKLQSAGIIRRNRQNAKIEKDNIIKCRQHQIRNLKEEKLKREQEKFLEIENTVKQLEREEQEALENWKKLVEKQGLFFQHS